MRINEEIRIKEVRVTDSNGEQLGIMATKDALRLAEDKHLDLVEVAPKARPPCAALWISANIAMNNKNAKKKLRKSKRLLP